MSGRSRWLGMLALLAGVLVGLYVGRGRLLPAAARWLDVGQAPRKAEYVMVLGGEENTRPFVAAALVNAGLAGKVLITEMRASADVEEGISRPTHEIIRRVLQNRGVPAEDILVIGNRGSNTFDEAQALAEFLKNSPDARVSVVTSFYHTRRAKWIFTRVAADRAEAISFVSAPAYGFRPEDWWRFEEGTEAVVSEYLKLVFYGMRYGRLGYWGLGCAAVVLVILVAVRCTWPKPAVCRARARQQGSS